MRILITGATGFLGKNLVTSLNLNKYEILSITKKKNKKFLPKKFKLINDGIELKNGDSFYKIKKFKPEIIIHLAWNNIPDFSCKMSLSNLTKQINFFKKLLVLSSIKKIIITGSCWEYGNKLGKCLENKDIEPSSYFTWAKNSLREFVKIECAKKKIKLVWFRIFYMYGPHQKKNSLLPSILNKLKNKKIPKIYNLNNKNDFIYVSDVCDGILKSIKTRSANGIFNLGSGKLTKVLDIYKYSQKIVGTRVNKIDTKKKLTVKKNHQYASITKIKKELNWKAKTGIRQGIRKTWEYLNEQ